MSLAIKIFGVIIPSTIALMMGGLFSLWIYKRTANILTSLIPFAISIVLLIIILAIFKAKTQVTQEDIDNYVRNKER